MFCFLCYSSLIHQLETTRCKIHGCKQRAEDVDEDVKFCLFLQNQMIISLNFYFRTVVVLKHLMVVLVFKGYQFILYPGYCNVFMLQCICLLSGVLNMRCASFI